MAFLNSALKRVFTETGKGLILPIVSCAIVLGQGALLPADAKEGISWTREVNHGLTQAKQDSKYVLADVYTDWCGWCKRLDSQTFSDPTVTGYLSDKFVCIKVNAEDHGEGEALARKYRVDGFPCALVFDQSGKFIGRLSGFMPPQQYQDALQNLVAHPNP